jgi:hypothetical protein
MKTSDRRSKPNTELTFRKRTNHAIISTRVKDCQLLSSGDAWGDDQDRKARIKAAQSFAGRDAVHRVPAMLNDDGFVGYHSEPYQCTSSVWRFTRIETQRFKRSPKPRTHHSFFRDDKNFFRLPLNSLRSLIHAPIPY